MQDKTTRLHMHQMHSYFHTFRIYLILYTRLFTKLNLFDILFYGTFITTKISGSMVVTFQYVEVIVASI